MMRIVLVGDVGETAPFHVGDEAMTLALIEDAARTGTPDWTLPENTSERGYSPHR